jgi:hypothetical protein
MLAGTTRKHIDDTVNTKAVERIRRRAGIQRIKIGWTVTLTRLRIDALIISSSIQHGTIS